MSDNKLKIRIQIQQPKTSEQEGENEQAENIIPDYDAQTILKKPPLDWRKIAVASTIFITAAGLTGYLLFGRSNSETTPDHTSSKAESITDSVSLYNNFENEFSKSPTDLSYDSTVVTEKAEAKENVSTSITEQFVTVTNDINMESDAAQIITPDSKPEQAKKTASLKPSLKPGQTMDTQQQPPVSHDSNRITSVSVPSDAVDHDQIIRAQLTHAVKRREPVDKINQIQLDQNSARNIYFFVELHDLAGQQVTVNWYFKEQHIAETQLEVNGQNWRTYANKLLNNNSIGPWRVTLTDEAGEQLAERHFVVNNNM
ncbi:MAG: DUF2914 domain-containing protein [Burkholderiales bacterium]|nr:DUF2914 domain-containing protein [Burkholderiales bacterium]